jgi:bacteriochlorophyll 4-vinyl reductase
MPTFSIAPASIHRLRRRLQASDPHASAVLLQEAGFATGEALYARWREQVHLRTTMEDPSWLDQEWFAPLFSELCHNLGWGKLEIETLGGYAIILSSSDWTEAEADTSSHPSCHFSCGCFAAFLTAQASAPLAVLEVECRSRGDDACRFLAGSTENLAAVYDLITAGGAWREALPSAAA